MKTIQKLLRLAVFIGMLLGASPFAATASPPVPKPERQRTESRTRIAPLRLEQTPARNDSTSNESLAAEKSVSLEKIGHLGGLAYAVALDGNYAYLATQGELAVLDVLDPANPVRVGYVTYPSYANPGITPRTLLISNGYAYMTNSRAGTLEIFNVSDPSKPSYAGRVNPPVSDGTYFSGMAIYGENLYLTQGFHLQIYRLSQPGQPQHVGSFPINFTYLSLGFAISGHYAYVMGFDNNGTGDWGLEILDLTDPEAPHLAGSLQNLYGEALAVQGDYAYIIEMFYYDVLGRGNARLHTVDVSNPASPALVGTLDIDATNNYRLVAVNQSLYAVGSYPTTTHGLLIFSLLDPSQPVLQSSNATLDLAWDLALTPDSKYALVAEYGRGLRTIEISDPQNPVEVGAFDPPSSIYSMAAANGLVFTSLDTRGIRSVDLSDPRNPETVGSLPAWENAYDLHVDGNFAYAAEPEGGGIRIYNIADPAHMVEVASLSGSFDRMALSEGYLYAWQYDPDGLMAGLLVVIDVSDPAHPVQAGTYSAFSITDVALTGRIAYIATGSLGCQIVDFSDPANPKNMGQCSSQFAWAIEISGGYAYLMTEPGMLVLDISNPLEPLQVGEYSYPVFENYWLSVYGDLAFLYRSDVWKLIVLDVSDPSSPRQVLDADFGAYHVVIREGDMLYLGGDTGLSVMRLAASLSGRVRDASAYPASGVKIQTSSGISTTTGSDGAYLLENMPVGSFTITPTLSGYTFVPPSRSVTLPRDDADQDFTLLPEPVSITASPGVAANLVYTGYQGTPTSFEIPPEAFAQTAQVIVTPTLASSGVGISFTGHAFDLSAQDGQGPILDFAAPVTATIAYTDFDIRFVTDESKLALYYWDGSDWTDAAGTCSPASAYTRDLANHQISLPICQTGKYALYGPTHTILMPVIKMNFH